MSNFVLDLSNYRDTVGARVTPGRYKVVVDDCEMDKSKAGNQMINVWYRIVGGEFDGATLTDRLTITEKALFRIVGFMQAIGLQTPKKRLNLDLRKFVGKMLEVDVEDGDPYNGRVKSEVRGYIRLTGSNAAAAAEDVDDLPEAEEDASPEAGDPEPAPAKVQEKAAETDEPEEIDLESLDLG